jgi:acetate kinase
MNTDMPSPYELLLTVNGGSSSIKFAVFEFADPLKRVANGQIERIGTASARLIAKMPNVELPVLVDLPSGDASHATAELVGFLERHFGSKSIVGVSHRVVHGGPNLLDHQPITADVIDELVRIQSWDLAHLPHEIALIRALQIAYPHSLHVACLDTAFYRELPHISKLLPISKTYLQRGIRKYGFHGLSYTYLVGKLESVAGLAEANGRVILAHLGSGASMTAIKNKQPLDTSMSMTPNAGLMMGTRPGDLDPALIVQLMREDAISLDEMDRWIAQRCGLFGVSGGISDMRDLLSKRDVNADCADAIALFCHSARKYIGSFSAVLNGLDTIVFTGGIGENVPDVRKEICAGFDYLGLEIDQARNHGNEPVISSESSRVRVRVIQTDEESVMARIVLEQLQSRR